MEENEIFVGQYQECVLHGVFHQKVSFHHIFSHLKVQESAVDFPVRFLQGPLTQIHLVKVVESGGDLVTLPGHL